MVMKRKIIHTTLFNKKIDVLFKKKQILQEDFDEFKRNLTVHPEMGDLISGTGGVRKTRLKSSTRGKSGSFRICYYFLTKKDEIFLILIYPKNVQEDLTMQQKKDLKQIVNFLRGKNV